MVNYVAHLEAVFLKFVEDDRTTPWHFSLYMAMFHIWNNCMFRDEINVRRDELMHFSKIGSANTYTRCIKELSEWNYIKYIPSGSKYKSSKVHMYRFDNGGNKGRDNGTANGSDNAPVQHLRPFINVNKTIENNRNTTNKIKGELNSLAQSKTPKRFVPPTLDEVRTYFLEKKSTATEGEKFFNHFQSNGWLVGGRTKMKDWKAAANNWILRSASYAEQANPTLKRLNANQNTNYNEPL